MIKEQGTIKKIKRDKAVIRIQQTSACASCKSRGSCNVSNREMLVEVINNLHAKEGDLVELSVPEGAVLKLSLLVYFMPILALIIGAFAGAAVAGSLRVDSTLASILGGVLCMGIAFYGLRRFEQAKRSGDKYYPRMTRILVSSHSQ